MPNVIRVHDDEIIGLTVLARKIQRSCTVHPEIDPAILLDSARLARHDLTDHLLSLISAAGISDPPLVDNR